MIVFIQQYGAAILRPIVFICWLLLYKNITKSKLTSINIKLFMGFLLTFIIWNIFAIFSSGNPQLARYVYLFFWVVATIYEFYIILKALLLSLILIQFPGFDEIVKIAYTLSIFSMLPISGLDGAKIFFGSLPLYLFGVGFISLSIILIHLLAPIWILVISIITAIILSLIFLESNF